jgi:hypothetical protein
MAGIRAEEMKVDCSSKIVHNNGMENWSLDGKRTFLRESEE